VVAGRKNTVQSSSPRPYAANAGKHWRSALIALVLALGVCAIGENSHVVEQAVRPARLANGSALSSYRLDCRAEPRVINRNIYGIGAAQDQTGDDELWLSATIRRWGGNPTSRYNWQLGNAWNTGSDWFFENVDYVGRSDYSYRDFVSRNQQHGMATALTVPMLGWVAKDVTSVGFPRSRWPQQDAFDVSRSEAGNGLGASVALGPDSPKQTSVAAPPSFVRSWVETIRREDAARGGTRSIQQYILDNEPNLWSSTHRDVRTQPLGYDELLDRTLRYGAAIRAADPEAVIAGPAEWGWVNYFQSDLDRAARWHIPWDRIRHGYVALVPWYLRELAQYEQRTHTRILDILDLHYYPQAPGVYGPATDTETNALRIRSTRSLWDPTYVDESWIAEPVSLLPRMHNWVAENYPGLGISIGEWSFGAEGHMSGGLATAEALGRFGTQSVTSAFYWAFPRAETPTAWAFRAYRNFDGAGAAFEELSVPALHQSASDTSVFASRSVTSARWVLVLLNFDAAHGAQFRIETTGCRMPTEARAFSYAGARSGLARTGVDVVADSLRVELPAYALGVVELSVIPGT
jgi:hypothetical protein